MQTVEMISAIAAPLTFLALIWYTVETQKLRRAAEKQNRLATMPIIVLSLSSGTRGLGEPMALLPPKVRNVGVGPAFEVQVGPIEGTRLQVTFGSVPLLEPKEAIDLDFTILQDGATTGFSKTMPLLGDSFEKGRLPKMMAVTATYSDFSGKRYRSNHVVQFDPMDKTVTTALKITRTSKYPVEMSDWCEIHYAT